MATMCRAMILLLGICLRLIASSDSTSTSAGMQEEAGGRYDMNFTQEQRLLYYLLKNYEKAVRPVRNASHAIVVKLGLTLTNIFDMDEKNQVLTTNVWLDQEWNDELLTWDPEEFDGITSIRIPCDVLWLPDIVLYNNADDYTTGYMRSRAMVQFDGTVFWPPPTQLRSTCKIDVTYFPFDSQRCFLKFGSWTYHGFQVDITNRSENIDLTNYVVSGEFELISVHQKRRVIKYTCCPEPYPDVTFFIHVRRKTLYYMYNVVFPCMMMSALTLLVFCLPPDSGEKIALGITVLLAFSVFVLAIAEKMPETSDSMPLIGIYLTVVMGMTSVSVVMTVMVLNFHHRGPFHKEVPPWLRWLILNRLRRILCMKLPYQQTRARGSNGGGGGGGGHHTHNGYSHHGAEDSSFLRRISLKMTVDSLQSELMCDMGLDRKLDGMRGVCGNNHHNSIGQYQSMGGNGFICNGGAVGGRRQYRPGGGGGARRSGPNYTQLGGGAPPNNVFPNETPVKRNDQQQQCPCYERSALQREVLKTLQMLISRQELDDECEEIANEWRQVAQVLDRLLFWVFLVATVGVTLVLLILLPLIYHNMETMELDEKLYGIR